MHKLTWEFRNFCLKEQPWHLSSLHLTKPICQISVAIRQHGLCILLLGILTNLLGDLPLLEQQSWFATSQWQSLSAFQSWSGNTRVTKFSMTVWGHCWSPSKLPGRRVLRWYVPMSSLVWCTPFSVPMLPITQSNVSVNAVVLVTKNTASGMDTLCTLDSKLQGF